MLKSLIILFIVKQELIQYPTFEKVKGLAMEEISIKYPAPKIPQ